MKVQQTRRVFLRQSALAATGFWIGGTMRGAERSTNQKLNLAFIGVGGRGAANMAGMTGENVVALCDVDENNLGRAAEKYPKARKYRDFRKLYDNAKDIDAVVVSTTEHTHAFATLPALRLGKHVYCEKPLAHSVEETRAVMNAASEAKVATQMGTQIHATENYRRVFELVQGGAIGPVSEVFVWVGRAWGGGARPQGSYPTPRHLDWDLWLGPASARAFHPDYVPGPKWYRYWDFGGGTLPDLGSHWNDLPFWALKLRQPTTIEAEGPPVSPETAPAAMSAHFEFPARDDLPPVKLTWHQGGKKPALVVEGKVPAWNDGVLFVGSRGMLLADYSKHVLLPEAQFSDFKRSGPSIPRSLGHYAEWLNACKTGAPTTCPFSYSGLLTETNLLGIVAYRLGKKLHWDSRDLRATNCPEADHLLRKQYRSGWAL